MRNIDQLSFVHVCVIHVFISKKASLMYSYQQNLHFNTKYGIFQTKNNFDLRFHYLTLNLELLKSIFWLLLLSEKLVDVDYSCCYRNFM